MKKKMILEKWKTKAVAMMMAGVMVFAMAPLGVGVAFADEEDAAAAEDAVVAEEGDAAVEAEDAVETEDAVEAKVSSPYIYASDILDYSGLLDDKGYLNLSHDTILYIDADCTIHGIDGDNRTYDYATQQWDGPIYNLTIRGDGTHTLTIEADISGNDAVTATDITMESGNVVVDMTSGFGIHAFQDFNMKGGSFEMTVRDNSTWAPFYAEKKVNVSGGTLSVFNYLDRATNGAIVCMEFEMTGGDVTASAEKYGRGLWSHDKTVIFGGTLNLTGHYEGFYTTGSFEVSGGSVTATATKEDGDAFELRGTAPAFGENVKITDPVDGVIGSNGEYFFVADVTVSPVRTATIKYVEPKKANTLALKGKTVKLYYKTLKKKTHTYKISKFVTVSKAKGPVTYTRVSGNKKISISKSGKVTIKKTIKKGTYKVKVKATAAGNDYYNKGTKTTTFTIKVK